MSYKYLDEFTNYGEIVEYSFDEANENIYIALNSDERLYYNEKLSRLLSFRATGQSTTVKLVAVGSPDAVSLEYSIDKSTWIPYTVGTPIQLANPGEYVSFRGTNYSFCKDGYNYYSFVIENGAATAFGDVTSLINGVGGDCDLPNYCFVKLFNECALLSAAPALPSTTASQYCYYSMFAGCIGLQQAPKLPATTVNRYCYWEMFRGCSGIKDTPVLPAMTLANACYMDMFRDCTNLERATLLPAPVLANLSYYYMFYGCTKLKYIRCLATNVSASNCLGYWTYSISPIGTFVKSADISNWPRGDNGIAYNWTIIDE